MRLIDYIKAVRSKGQRYFTIKQLMLDCGLSKNTALAAIHRLKVQGDLISPVRGLYVIVPPEHQPQGSLPAEELTPILMKYLGVDYYVSLLSAAEFYGAAHQKAMRFQIITNKRIKRPLIFGQVQLEIIYKKSLTNLPLQNFTVATGYLKVAKPELIAFDLLSYPTRIGGLNHIATVLAELIEAIDADKLIDLAKQINETAWLQRLGFILEKIEPLDENKVLRVLEKLQDYLSDKAPAFVSLASELPKSGFPRIKKWHIIENTEVESDL